MTNVSEDLWMDIAEEAKQVELFGDCKKKLDAVLKSAGLLPSKGRKSGEPASNARKHADDLHASAMAKAQASNDASASTTPPDRWIKKQRSWNQRFRP